MSGTSICPDCGCPVPDEYAEQHYTHDCEGATMTTHSRERREAVALSIGHTRFSKYGPGPVSEYDLELADAALAACRAYLAARPTPDAEAMEREFVAALGQYGIARTAYFRGEDVTWSSVQDSEQAVLDLFRKAVTR